MNARWMVALALAGCSAGDDEGVLAPDGAAAPDVAADVSRPPLDAPTYDVTPLDAARDADAAVAVDAARDVAPDLTREQFCMGAGPPVVVGDRVTMSTRCIGRIAEAVFRHAICTCTDLGLAGYLQTDSFDSGAAMMTSGEHGGAVGINGGLSLVGVMRLGDALTMSGTTPLRLVGAHTVRGDLSLQGDLQVVGTLDVERNARVRGGLLALGPFHVRGDLTTPPGSLPIGGISVDGSRRTAPVDVAPPCACRASEIFDVAGAVSEASTHNDNAAAGFRSDVFNAVVGEARVELPCGRFYVDRIAGLGAITLSVQGRTALFVGGDFDLGGYFNVSLGAAGELDVFVAGSILGAGYLRMGRVSRPSKVRFYIGGDRGFTLAGVAGFQGNVYAPRAPVTIAGFNEMRGSLFAGRVATAGDLTIHYDRSVLRAGEDCPSEPPPAGGCTGCGAGVCRSTQACVSGACGMCRSDADCCAPFVCEARTGQCLPIPP
ncbi:MAG: hypothetical protein U0326_33565 [Polyangiales bacterium]